MVLLSLAFNKKKKHVKLASCYLHRTVSQ